MPGKRIRKPIDKEAKRLYDQKRRRDPEIVKTNRMLAQKRYIDPMGRAKNLCANAKKRARIRGKEFDISVAHIHVILMIGRCQKTGLPFDLTPANNTMTKPFAPSIDRIDNDNGYVTNNVQIVCNMFNSGKNEHHEIDFIAMCVAVADRYRDDPIVIARLAELRNAGI